MSHTKKVENRDDKTKQRQILLNDPCLAEPNPKGSRPLGPKPISQTDRLARF